MVTALPIAIARKTRMPEQLPPALLQDEGKEKEMAATNAAKRELDDSSDDTDGSDSEPEPENKKAKTAAAAEAKRARTAEVAAAARAQQEQWFRDESEEEQDLDFEGGRRQQETAAGTT